MSTETFHSYVTFWEGFAVDKPAKDNLARARISIMGEEYVIRGEGSKDYIEGLGRMVDTRMRQLARTYPNLSNHKIAILTSIYLADEVQKLMQEKFELEELLSELD